MTLGIKLPYRMRYVSSIPARIEIGFRGGPVPMLPSAVDGSLFIYVHSTCVFVIVQSVSGDVTVSLKMSQLIPCLDNGSKYVPQHTLVESATGIEYVD